MIAARSNDSQMIWILLRQFKKDRIQGAGLAFVEAFRCGRIEALQTILRFFKNDTEALSKIINAKTLYDGKTALVALLSNQETINYFSSFVVDPIFLFKTRLQNQKDFPWQNRNLLDLVDFNLSNIAGMSALKWAIYYQNSRIVKSLLAQKNLDVNALNKTKYRKGETPLAYAIQKENLQILSYLLADPRLDINAPNGDGTTALHEALRGAKMDILKLILTHPGFDIEKNLMAAWTEEQKTSFRNDVRNLIAFFNDYRPHYNPQNEIEKLRPFVSRQQKSPSRRGALPDRGLLR